MLSNKLLIVRHSSTFVFVEHSFSSSGGRKKWETVLVIFSNHIFTKFLTPSSILRSSLHETEKKNHQKIGRGVGMWETDESFWFLWRIQTMLDKSMYYVQTEITFTKYFLCCLVFWWSGNERALACESKENDFFGNKLWFEDRKWDEKMRQEPSMFW